MFVLRGLIGNTQRNCFDAAAAGGASPFDVSYLTSNVDLSDATVYTHAGLTFGAADADRKIVASVLSLKVNPYADISSVTIGGVSASVITGATTSIDVTGAGLVHSLYEADVPTGTSGDVVVTVASTTLRSFVSLWRVVSGTSSAGAANSADAQTTRTLTPTIPSGGVGIFASYASLSTTFNAWTNLDTENFDSVVEGTRCSSGGVRTTAGTTAVTANVGTSSLMSIVCAVYS